jgi:hypothetical protein
MPEFHLDNNQMLKALNNIKPAHKLVYLHTFMVIVDQYQSSA